MEASGQDSVDQTASAHSLWTASAYLASSLWGSVSEEVFLPTVYQPLADTPFRFAQTCLSSVVNTSRLPSWDFPKWVEFSSLYPNSKGQAVCTDKIKHRCFHRCVV